MLVRVSSASEANLRRNAFYNPESDERRAVRPTRASIDLYVYLRISIYICVYILIYVCMCLYILAQGPAHGARTSIDLYLYIRISIYICVYILIYVSRC